MRVELQGRRNETPQKDMTSLVLEPTIFLSPFPNWIRLKLSIRMQLGPLKGTISDSTTQAILLMNGAYYTDVN
jgi:hypothetical protein